MRWSKIGGRCLACSWRASQKLQNLLRSRRSASHHRLQVGSVLKNRKCPTRTTMTGFRYLRGPPQEELKRKKLGLALCRRHRPRALHLKAKKDGYQWKQSHDSLAWTLPDQYLARRDLTMTGLGVHQVCRGRALTRSRRESHSLMQRHRLPTAHPCPHWRPAPVPRHLLEVVAAVAVEAVHHRRRHHHHHLERDPQIVGQVAATRTTTTMSRPTTMATATALVMATAAEVPMPRTDHQQKRRRTPAPLTTSRSAMYPRRQDLTNRRSDQVMKITPPATTTTDRKIKCRYHRTA
mmetsp:Transcript_4743/g.13665  ORF Transcript_4743/g.13665 Transcript_4743/m.13665 type:complete len:293 (-) Transcript_4743:544-1422(-)